MNFALERAFSPFTRLAIKKQVIKCSALFTRLIAWREREFARHISLAPQSHIAIMPVPAHYFS
jgi:hypothetical protein